MSQIKPKQKQNMPNSSLQNLQSQATSLYSKSPSTNFFRFWANNPCSLNSEKRHELVARLNSIDKSEWPHVIFFSETWFGATSDTSIAGYQLHKTGLSNSEVNEVTLTSTSVEQIWHIIHFENESILLGCMYRPIDKNDDKLNQILASIKAARQALSTLKCSTMLLYGDFNFSHTSYQSCNVGGGVETTAHVTDQRPGDIKFQECLKDCYLTQLVTFPTYRNNTLAIPSSTLDLIITNDPDRLISIDKGDSFGHTPMGKAHCLLVGLFAVYFNKNKLISPCRRRLVWSKANFEAISSHVTSKVIPTNLSINDMYSWFIEIYNESVNLHIPSTTNPFKTKQDPWVTPKVLEAVKAKRTIWAKYIAAGKDSQVKLRNEHQAACKHVKKVVNAAVLHFEQQLVSSFKYFPKRLHSHVKNKLKVHNPISMLETSDGNITTDYKVISSTINNYFHSVFVEEPPTPIPTFKDRTTSICEIDDSLFTSASVENYLCCLDETKSMGLDGIHPRILKNCAKAFALPLSLIFIQSFQTGDVPDLWRESNVTPIFKKGNKLKACNYRPVSLTSVPCKVMERIIKERILKHCSQHNLISKSQHGFVHNKGCLTNLIESRDIITEAAYRGHLVDIIFTDFAKAFDTVPHRRLLHKIQAYGIRGQLFHWISAWLTKRKQRVVIGEQTSEWKRVTSGVPQGSVLGPLLFVLFVNDYPDDISNYTKLYADDSKIIGIININQSSSDYQKLQTDIDSAVNWSHNWLMHFNIEKCKVMHVGCRKNKSTHIYTMADINGIRRNLSPTCIERDLGVLISDNLKVKAQVEAAASAGNRMLGRLKKTFRCRSLQLWKKMYQIYVRPHLEFSIQSWSPYLKSDIALLERVQKRATKTISSIKHFKYEKRLQILGLTTLEERRTRSDLILQYKIVHQLQEIEFHIPQVYPFLSNSRYNLRRNSRCLKPQLIKSYPERQHYFTNRVYNI
ncbi:MAG: hypothetical protein K2P53_06055 [Rickettsiales bacterium]|nr:hypothetical protein [Rickettsiales bacterium]